MTNASQKGRSQDSDTQSTTPRRVVKVRIRAAGLSMGQVARAAGISRSSLSNHVSGHRRNHETQYRIWRAFCDVARVSRVPVGRLPGMADFWGDLLKEGAA